jgi:hypothetical protein
MLVTRFKLRNPCDDFMHLASFAARESGRQARDSLLLASA